LLKSIAAQVCQYFFGITELRHQKRIAEIGNLDVATAGKDQLLGIKYLGAGGNKLFKVLKSIPYSDVANRYSFRHPGKNFPVIVFGHDGKSLLS
jgi:hypothetical protein